MSAQSISDCRVVRRARKPKRSASGRGFRPRTASGRAGLLCRPRVPTVELFLRRRDRPGLGDAAAAAARAGGGGLGPGMHPRRLRRRRVEVSMEGLAPPAAPAA